MSEIIKVIQFSKNFSGKTIHKDINFKVYEGECLGLLGGSGAGKSVILRSLIGLEKPTSGQILINDVDVVKLSEQDLFKVRRDVAYVFQYGALFDSMTVFDNLAYPLNEHTQLSKGEIKDLITSTLAEFNLEGTEQLLPNELSGGMQKRVCLARAIILNPKVVLYDEPTAGLDPANTIAIQGLISKLKNKGNTSILVTHDMDTAFAVCDRVCLLKNHGIIELEPVDELKKNKEHFFNYFAKGQA